MQGVSPKQRTRSLLHNKSAPFPPIPNRVRGCATHPTHGFSDGLCR
ncbi:hypothetical protein HMPREF9123_0431 [Neisseria bacilliformis ATCC BAA-1200]|uniref:Uncharacterized protein n=1 Tax=Neisseria bacilliformis ATCC BAA-1200 TaxID=888742 RepID=F2B9Q9_9NEIS|nr:hypothetical protein HMPREF9123_0431 [Neisseria bacilliformis ATCC BAA-1200]